MIEKIKNNKLFVSKNLTLSKMSRTSASIISQGDSEIIIKPLTPINLVLKSLKSLKHIEVAKYKMTMVVG